MRRAVTVRVVAMLGIAAGLILAGPEGWAAPEGEFMSGELSPEEVFVPIGMMGPPSEKAFQALLDAGFLTRLGFEQAMASLHAIEHRHLQWHVGIMPYGFTGSRMGPPSEEELRAAFKGGHMSQEEFEWALEGLRAWEAAGDDPEALEALGREYGHGPPDRLEGQRPRYDLRTPEERRR